MKKVRAAACSALAGALALAVLAPAPGRAAPATHLVNVFNYYFTPSPREAFPGDTVQFFWQEGGHSVKAYRGDSFDSGILDTNSTFSVPFAGGTIRYRCAVHSYIDGAGQCRGMCAVISDDPNLDLTVPRAVVVKPVRNAIVTPLPTLDGTAVRNNVVMEGTATDNVKVDAVGVRLYDNTGRELQAYPDCTGCGTASATWTVAKHLLPGSYLVEAIAVDSSGNSFTTPRTTFFVV